MDKGLYLGWAASIYSSCVTLNEKCPGLVVVGLVIARPWSNEWATKWVLWSKDVSGEPILLSMSGCSGNRGIVESSRLGGLPPLFVGFRQAIRQDL